MEKLSNLTNLNKGVRGTKDGGFEDLWVFLDHLLDFQGVKMNTLGRKMM